MAFPNRNIDRISITFPPGKSSQGGTGYLRG